MSAVYLNKSFPFCRTKQLLNVLKHKVFSKIYHFLVLNIKNRTI